MRAIAKMAMGYLEARFDREIEFVAVEHNDHTDKKHIHSIALLRWKERVYVPELMALINTATAAAVLQRYALDQNLAFLQELEQAVPQKQHWRSIVPYDQPLIGQVRGRARHIRQARHATPPCPNGGILHQVKKLRSGRMWCRDCQELVKEKEKGMELGL